MKIKSLLMVITISFIAMHTSAQAKIGTQTWTTKNLDASTFKNGDSIPEVRSGEEWKKASLDHKAAWCYYDNDPENGKKYGKLYNWYAVNDARGLAPEGWHIPGIEEWLTLADYLGGEDSAGMKLKTKSGWMDDNGKDGNGSNKSGFAGLPGGSRDKNRFFGIGNNGMWWSATENPPIYAWTFSVYYHSSASSIYYDNAGYGLYVRCVKD
jgi:uncharacterized protein (TIGR02145 family)